MNAEERLRELIHGGPYDLHNWAVMVHLAAWADDEGVVEVPELALIGDWISGSEKWARWCLKHLRADGWITVLDDEHWHIGVNLRQGSHTHTR